MNKSKNFRANLILCGVIFCGFAALVYLAPYTHDDWAWGSQVGIDRLASNFDSYNGRYLGNYMVLLLTRSKILQVFVISASATLFCLLPSLFVGKQSILYVLVSLVLLLLMPKEIFTQTVVWTSGYSNYMPPIILSVIYFILIRNIFGKEKPVYSAPTSISVATLGICGCLFMEHVTLFNLAISFLVLIFVFIKYRRVYFPHLAFAAGCIAGSVIMFSNSSYGLIANANDAQGGYRSTALSGSFTETLKENIQIIGEQLFIKNIMIWILISCMLLFLSVSFMKSSATQKKKNIALGTFFVNVFCLFIIYAKHKYEYWFMFLQSDRSDIFTLLLFTLVMVIYCLSVLGIIVLCVSSKEVLMKMFLVLISIVIVTAPLAVVSPVSPRCFFPQYFLLTIFCILLLNYLIRIFKIKHSVYKTSVVSLAAIAASIFVFMLNIYSTVYTYENKRHEYIQKQIANAEETIKVCELPNTTYIYIGTPYEKMWQDRFKMFYGYDTDMQIEILNHKKFDEWAKEYDKKEEVK